MNYFVHPNSGELYAFDSDADESYMPEGLKSIGQAEFDALVLAKSPLAGPSQRIALARYKHEVSGILYAGVPIDTDRESQALISGAALSAVIDPSYVCNWKTREGPIQLDATKLIAIATAVRSHVQSCFDREFALLDLVDKGTFKEYLLEKGWPSSAE